MHLKTKIIETTSSEIFSVYMMHYVSRQKLLFTVLIGLIGWNIYQVIQGNIDALPLIGLIVILLLIILNLFRVFYRNDTQQRLSPKQFEIEADQLFVYPNKNNNQRVPINRLFKVHQSTSAYFLYFNKNHYYYLPFRFFEKEDKVKFDKWLRGGVSE